MSSNHPSEVKTGPVNPTINRVPNVDLSHIVVMMHDHKGQRIQPGINRLDTDHNRVVGMHEITPPRHEGTEAWAVAGSFAVAALGVGIASAIANRTSFFNRQPQKQNR